VALLEKRRFLYNHSGDFPQVILIIPSHVPNKSFPRILRIRLNTFRAYGDDFCTANNPDLTVSIYA
jgi:hypothetical protein